VLPACHATGRGIKDGGFVPSKMAENCDLTIKNCDLTIKNGDLTIRNGDLTIKNGDLR
jgi:hypothetical protein